jgi:uncharacterized protein YjiS (DUF1127 family)
MDTTNTIHATDTTCDPRPFLRHMALAQAWCRWNGQRGTELQVLRRMRQLTAAQLEQMLAARGITVA